MKQGKRSASLSLLFARSTATSRHTTYPRDERKTPKHPNSDAGHIKVRKEEVFDANDATFHEK